VFCGRGSAGTVAPSGWQWRGTSRRRTSQPAGGLHPTWWGCGVLVVSSQAGVPHGTSPSSSSPPPPKLPRGTIHSATNTPAGYPAGSEAISWLSLWNSPNQAHISNCTPPLWKWLKHCTWHSTMEGKLIWKGNLIGEYSQGY